MTLVILAAGMSSRYGGLKQIDPINSHGEFIIDYSIHDAIYAGFDHIVFLIRKENLKEFKETIVKRIEPFIKVDVAFQSLDMLPQGFLAPTNRTKPWGTAHAVLCCKEAVENDNFAIINSDDLYGREAFVQMAEALNNLPKGHYCMAGYILDNTLTDNGGVTRGICLTENDKLISIKDYTNVYRDGKTVYYSCNGCSIPVNSRSVVSMNFFGFGPDVFNVFEDEFRTFLMNNEKDTNAEFSTALALEEGIQNGACIVDVFHTNAKWTGVTYAKDKSTVMEKIRKMTEAGIYPEVLWK